MGSPQEGAPLLDVQPGMGSAADAVAQIEPGTLVDLAPGETVDIHEAADVGEPGHRLAAGTRCCSEIAEEDIQRDPDAGHRQQRQHSREYECPHQAPNAFRAST